jgi:hypothetical protein
MQGTDHPEYGKNYPTQNDLYVPQGPQKGGRGKTVLSKWKGWYHQDLVPLA